MHIFLPLPVAKNGTPVVCKENWELLSVWTNNDLHFFCVAPEAVLEADGGTLTDVLGNHYQYGADVAHLNKSGVIATIKDIEHASIISKIPEELKNKLK